ncbi:MAG: sulfite exporter TauE/SafE family protein [Planctomycetia bacterium]
MIEWPLLVASGMLGSAHCLGMCGPFALAIGSAAPDWRANLARQLLYSVGRIFTYAVLGVAAAFVGLEAAKSLADWGNISAVLAIVAGLVLLVQGLWSAGILPHRGVGAGACPGAGMFRTLLGGRSLVDVFLAGLFTGFLPCGLLYGMLALAASTGNLVQGLVTMAAFGAGTVPAMVMAGVGGSLVGLATRRRINTVAAWCLMLTGLISIARGATAVSLSGAPPAACPFCSPAKALAPSATPPQP